MRTSRRKPGRVATLRPPLLRGWLTRLSQASALALCLLLPLAVFAQEPEVEACAEGQVPLDITINTDNFGGETSWELTTQFDQTVSGIDESSLLNNTTYNWRVCLDPCEEDLAYNFTIFDSFGDGICCGVGEGSYTVELDGNLIGSGGDFGSEETTLFVVEGVPGGDGPFCNDPLDCDETEVFFQADILADNFGGEIALELRNENGEVLLAASGLSSNALSSFGVCVEACAEYEFEIFDSFEDGICCAFGMGSYELSVNNEVFYQSDGIYGAGEVVPFTAGDGCEFEVEQIGCTGDGFYDPESSSALMTAQGCVYTSPFTQDETILFSQELCGDGEIIAELTSIDPFGWGGVTMRESAAPGSKKVALSRDNGFYARREIRTATNAMSFPQQFPAFGKNWMRLVRTGNQFVGYISTNGGFWQQVMAANISMNECIEIGLFASNKIENQAITATFANISVSDSNVDIQPTPTAEQGAAMIYPNPTTGVVNINLTDWQDKAIHLELQNTNGQILNQLDLGTTDDRRLTLQLGTLPAGIYWLRIQPEGEAPLTERLVVQRP